MQAGEVAVEDDELDTDGDNLPSTEDLEEVLFTLQRWESEEPGPDQEPMDLPAPVAAGRALAALTRVRAALADSQGEQAVAAGRTGRLWARTVDRDWGLEPGSRIELAPLRLVDVDQGDVETLTALSAVLSGPHLDGDIADAAEQVAECSGRALEEIYRAAAGLAALSTVEWDERARALADDLAALAPGQDLNLTAGQAAAYRSICTTIVKTTGGDALDLFVAGAWE